MKENLAEQRMIVSIGCHLPTKHVQMGARSPVPSYLMNLSALNLRGIMTSEKLVKLFRLTLPQALEPSIIRIFSVIVFT